jgi:RHS repeat-associated protein
LDLLGDVQDSTLTTYGYDALSVRQHYDESGDVAAQYRYTPFGTPMGEGPAGYGFTGEMWHGDVGLVNLRARYYRPAVGRFVSRDRWPGRRELPQSLDRWVYVQNSPLNLTDPSGNTPPDPNAIIFETSEMRCAGERSCYLAQFCTLPTAVSLPPPPALRVFDRPPVLPEWIEQGSTEHQGFGPTEFAKRHQYAGSGMHGGLDIDTRATQAGNQVLQAVCTGRVIHKGTLWGAGPVSVVIRCEGTWLAVQYGHLDMTSVNNLERGDVILEGTHFGRPDENAGHLHFETRSLHGVSEDHFEEGGRVVWRYNPAWLFTAEAWSQMALQFGDAYINPFTGKVDPTMHERSVWAYRTAGSYWDDPENYPIIWAFAPTPPSWR